MLINQVINIKLLHKWLPISPRTLPCSTHLIYRVRIVKKAGGGGVAFENFSSFDSERDFKARFTNHFIPTGDTNNSPEAGMHRPKGGEIPPYKSHPAYVYLITSDICSIQPKVISALRHGHHQIFRHGSSSKRAYMFHTKGIRVCET